MERLESSKQSQQITERDGQITPVLSQEEVTAITPAETPKEKRKPPSPSKPRRQLLKFVVAMLFASGALAAGIYSYRWWLYAQRYQQTDNAYVSAEIYPVTSRVGGVVNAVTVQDNQTVSPGDVLVQIDPREYQVALTQAKTGLELAKQQAEFARQNIDAVATTPQETVRPILGTTQIQRVVVPRLPDTNQQKEANRQQYKATLAAIAQKEAELKEAELKFSYTRISALVPGQVGNKSVRVGQQIEAGQTLMEVVQPNPWVIANFQETQLGKIQPGQKAEIKIAAFSNRKFLGKVDSLSPASFGRFAPVQLNNSTGNASNSVQRIPVKIMLDPESTKGFESRITPGMSADVKVEIK
jgi:membrane fusion protein, multidrug efflux system